MLAILPISTDFSDGNLHGWTTASGPAPVVVAVTGQSFPQAITVSGRDSVNPAILHPGAVQVKVTGWLNGAGLAGHPSDGNSWKVSLGVLSMPGYNWQTSAALQIAAGTGWTFVSDILTLPAGATLQAWVQVDAATITPYYAQAAVLNFALYYGTTPVIALPWDTIPGVTAPSSIEWRPHEYVAATESPFTGQMQVFDWQQSRLDAQVSFPPMTRRSRDAWAAFVRSCRGPLHVFQMGDPRAALPKGSGLGAPAVDGAGQKGYALASRGWPANARSLLLPGDNIQIGYRLYSVDSPVNADNNGKATLRVWPPLRDLPPDGAVIVMRNCKGLFRLAQASGNHDSVNAADYGFSGFEIREAL